MARFKAGIADIQSKLNVIEEYKQVEAGNLTSENKAAYEQYVKAATSPLATHGDKGFTLDASMAVKAGISDQTLKQDWGLSDKEVDMAKTQAKLSMVKDLPQFARQPGGMDLIRKAQGYGMLTPSQVVDIQSASSDIAIRKQAADRLGGLIDTKGNLVLEQAITAGIAASTIRNAGFNVSQKEYNDLKRWVEAKPIDKFNIMVQQKQIPAGATFAGMDEKGNIKYTMPGKQAVSKDNTTLDTIKQIWQVLTPWDETAGQSYLQYMKGYPSRLLTTLKGGTVESQESLKAEYEASKSSPLWMQVIFPVNVLYDSKTNTYYRLVTGEPPMVGPAGKTREVTQTGAKVIETVRKVVTAGPKEAGMTEEMFNAFVKARAANPKLTPEGFKAFQEALEKATKLGKAKAVEEAIAAAAKVKGSQLLPSERAYFTQMLDKLHAQQEATKIASAAKIAKEQATLAAKQKEAIAKWASEFDKQSIIAEAAVKDAASKIAPIDPTKTRYYQNLLKSNPAKAAEWLKSQRPLSMGKVVIVPIPNLQPQVRNQIKINNLQSTISSIQIRLKIVAQPAVRSKLELELRNLTAQRTKLEQQLKESIAEQVKTNVMTAIVLANAVQQLHETATETQTATQTQTQFKEAVEQQIKQLPSEATRAQVRQQIKQELQQRLANIATTGIATPSLRPVKGVSPRPFNIKPGERQIKRLPPPLMAPGKTETEAAKRKRIKESKGAVTYRMGQLHGKDVWHVVMDTGEHLVVIGRVPEGARIVERGKGSARKTTQRIGRKGFQPFSIKHGAVTANVRPAPVSRAGADISFTPLRSKKIGRQFYTPHGKTILISRRPLTRKRT